MSGDNLMSEKDLTEGQKSILNWMRNLPERQETNSCSEKPTASNKVSPPPISPTQESE